MASHIEQCMREIEQCMREKDKTIKDLEKKLIFLLKDMRTIANIVRRINNDEFFDTLHDIQEIAECNLSAEELI